jgi:hypothetical protein
MDEIEASASNKIKQDALLFEKLHSGQVLQYTNDPQRTTPTLAPHFGVGCGSYLCVCLFSKDLQMGQNGFLHPP